MDSQPANQEDKHLQPVTVSIVIITRNEANNIARAIESVLSATHDLTGVELLLVDSASTDQTVEIAKRYPIRIIRLKPDWVLSVPAGRHIGMHYTHGDYVLHMDGDMELEPEWVRRSAAYLSENPQVGAVGGYYRNIYCRDGEIIGEQDIHKDKEGKAKEVLFVGGAALYRREAIEQMGGFQPFIRGEEGVYMSMGICNAGYKVIQLPYLMSKHYCVPPQSLAYTIRRLRLDMWLGFGQVPRYYWGTALFWIYLKERGAFVLYYLGIVISISTFLASLITKNSTFFFVWILIVILFIVLFMIRKRSITKTIVSLITQTGIAISAFRGFLIKPRSSSEYPLDAEIVQ